MSPAGIILTDSNQADNPIVFVNAAFTAITGYSFDEAAGRNCRFLQGPETDQHSVAAIRQALASGSNIKIDILNYRKSGEPFWNELSIAPASGDRRDAVSFVAIQSDITIQRQLKVEKIDLEARLASIIESMPGYVFQRRLNPKGALALTYYGPSFAESLGFASGQQAAADVWDIIHPDDREQAYESISRSASDLSDLRLEFRVQTASGAERWVRNYSKPRRGEAGDVIWTGVGLDVTAEKLAEDKLSYLAYHDPLTGMPNRLLFATSLLRTLTASVRDERVVVLFTLDLDGFQEVNEEVGLSQADAVLRQVSKRIVEFADAHGGYAARIGGDEFAVFFAADDPGDDVMGLARLLCQRLAEPLQLPDRELSIEACVGAAVSPSTPRGSGPAGEPEVSELMKRAEIALQASKQAGRGTHRVYSVEADDRHRNQMVLRQSLRKAIELEQFSLHYHPLVDLWSGEIVGAEALLRWNHPVLGLQRPDNFIPLAEKSGLIVPLGAWVLGEAMRQAVKWRRSGIKVPKIAVNVSGVQLADPGFIGAVESALAQSGAKASQFEIELTEGFMIEANSHVLNVLWSLKVMGFTLAVDDFGTGHSSFRYLRDFPVDRVKIDQSFVRHMVIDSSDASIIRAIITLSRSLKLSCVAEGIETAVQRNFLRDEGCKIGQGYLFSLPLTAEDFAFLVDRDVTLPVSPRGRPAFTTADKVSDSDS
jgi:diguanylate cyclase (GGDEF)-like protein/PAS domain S-box-containing protein